MARPRASAIVIAVLAVFSFSFVGVGYWISRLDEQIMQGGGPGEGYYWTVVQYELAYLRMREAIEILALHGHIEEDELSKRVAVLMSKALILTDESRLTTFFESIPGFSAGKREIVAFHARVNAKFDSIPELQSNASELLEEFNNVEETILALANEVRMEEIEARDATLQSLLTQRRLLWMAVRVDFGLLLLWVLSVSLSWSRYAHEARARERALQSERIAVQAKTEFLGMVSHELRSPLQSIVSALDVLESQQALPGQASVTRRIRRSADELAVHLRDLLTLARGQGGCIELKPEVFEAAAMVREMVEDAAAAAEAKGLALTVETPSEPVFAVADGARIGQLLHNLIDNAVKYTNQGRVAVTLHAFDASAAALRFRVADTGPGLPASAAGTAASGFDAVPHQPGRGRGIGLAVVKALLKQLGGSLLVSSTPGGGTTVDLAVPAAAAEDRAPVEGSGSGRILVVGDRPERIEVLARACAAAALHCDTAASAAAALNLLAAHGHGFLLIDLGMSGQLAAELALKARACSRNGDARVLAVAARRGRSAAPGTFDAVLQWPVRREQIAAQVAAFTQPQRIRPAQPK